MEIEKYNGFEIGHKLLEVLSEAETTLEMDDAARIFNQGYGVLRSQLEVKEKIGYYGDRHL